MDGVLYSCENFDFFKDMMRLKLASKNYEGTLNTKNIDAYNLFNSSVIITKNPYKRILIVPENKESLKNIKSHLEEITRVKLTKVKSNGNQI